MAKYTYGREFHDPDTLPTWEQVKASHSDKYWKEDERRLARAKVFELVRCI